MGLVYFSVETNADIRLLLGVDTLPGVIVQHHIQGLGWDPEESLFEHFPAVTDPLSPFIAQWKGAAVLKSP